MSQTTASPLDGYRSQIESSVDAGLSYTDIAEYLRQQGVHTTRHSIRRALRRWGTDRPSSTSERPGITISGDEAEVTSEPQPFTSELADPPTLIRERGLDPEEWEIVKLTINEWDAMTSDKAYGDNQIVKMRQLKVYLKKKFLFNFVLPAKDRPTYVRPKSKARSVKGEGAKLIVAAGDQQAPYHDPRLHGLFCDWLEENQPDKGVLIGDTVDFPDISRHPDNPEWHVSAQECIDAGYLLLRDYVQSSESTDWTKLCGNHDERIRRRLLNYQTRLYDIKPANKGDGEERSVWHISNLLHLDDLGIEYVDPDGNYDHAQVRISRYLAARHGHIARKGAGSSALATLEHFGYSLLIGHTHRQALIHKTTHDIDGRLTTLAAAEIGCMCLIKGGLGYTPAPDWTNGFATTSVWSDGTFKIDLGTFVDGALYWRDQRFS